MLTEKRYELILELLDKKRSVTVPEIKEVLGVSESTIRRDLNALDKAGRLTKVFGGAVSSDGTFTGTEPSVAQKVELQQEEGFNLVGRRRKGESPSLRRDLSSRMILSIWTRARRPGIS